MPTERPPPVYPMPMELPLLSEKNVLGVIPARYGSSRFPGKPLALLNGKPMIQHTYMNSLKASSLNHLIVATDDKRIYDAVKSFGGEVMMTSADCKNGTERCLAVLRELQMQGRNFDIVVNIQGDEPLIEPEHIDVVAAIVAKSDAVMGTLARPSVSEDDVTNPNNVKAVIDRNGYALYFSRAMIPFNKRGKYDPHTRYFRKLGIYSYTADFLPKFLTMPPSTLQEAEDLEQNKVLEAGYRIKVGIVETAVHGVDTPQQLQDLEQMMQQQQQESKNSTDLRRGNGDEHYTLVL